ncbi:S-adenosyl-L-methionine-dependent methyltransferase [Leptodontidium sp. MPI-SDFR-AT-0119]|nr:S-adenosyl-L-methionine-dependent methyltransferase [Leptodontidium sp. MPI-SDFR-AT-0119]
MLTLTAADLGGDRGGSSHVGAAPICDEHKSTTEEETPVLSPSSRVQEEVEEPSDADKESKIEKEADVGKDVEQSKAVVEEDTAEKLDQPSLLDPEEVQELENPDTPSITTLSVDSSNHGSERDDDSALGDASIYTTSTSVRSSVFQFVQENGRTYHAYREGKYYLPNDEMEQDRLDLQHHLFLLTLSGELYNAPIKDIPGGLHNVLDIATGTGIWAIEFAHQFPSANVIGTDLSPIQPDFAPPNCHFEVDDAEDPWLFPYQFDYIHGRALATCFKSHLPVFRSAFAYTKPGGYFELQDCIVPFRCIDDSIKGTALERWVELIMAGTAKLGKDWTRVKRYREMMVEAGFEDVVERKYEWPVGTWARGERMKMLGLWYREDLLAGLQGFTVAVLTRALGMGREEVEVLLVGVREDIRSNKIHIYIPVRVVHGRKPLEIEQ